MAMIYKQPVSVYANSKGELTVKSDSTGKWSWQNTEALLQRMEELSKEHKMPVKVFKPEPSGTVPVLLQDRYGKPYLALLTPSKAPSKATITKLA